MFPLFIPLTLCLPAPSKACPLVLKMATWRVLTHSQLPNGFFPRSFPTDPGIEWSSARAEGGERLGDAAAGAGGRLRRWQPPGGGHGGTAWGEVGGRSMVCILDIEKT